MTFTGDDAIGLFDPDNRLIDLVGYESMDVNDRVSGVWGTDISFYRRPECCSPSAKFYPEQWMTYPMDYCEDFGTHEMDTYGDIKTDIKSVMLPGDATSVKIEGLTPATSYSFAIRGYSNGLMTHYSPVATATTLQDTGIGSPQDSAMPWRIDNGVLTLVPGAVAYTADGRLLGSGSIMEPEAGIVIVHADGKSYKIIL